MAFSRRARTFRARFPAAASRALTGSSFATPIVTGLAALLLTIQQRNGERMNPQAVRKAILDSALPCYPREALECAPYLAGTLNVPGAYDLTTRGGTTTVPDLAAGPIPSQAAEAVRQAVARVLALRRLRRRRLRSTAGSLSVPRASQLMPQDTLCRGDHWPPMSRARHWGAP